MIYLIEREIMKFRICWGLFGLLAAQNRIFNFDFDPFNTRDTKGYEASFQIDSLQIGDSDVGDFMMITDSTCW